MVSIIRPYFKSVQLALLSGVLLGLSVPGIGLWPLAWIGLVPALYALTRCESYTQAFCQGLVLGGVYYGILFWWFWGLHPLTWMGFSMVTSPLATALAWGMAMGSQTIILAIIWLAVYACYRKLGKRGLLLAPVWWVLGIWFLNQQPLGLPWGFLTYTQAGVPACRDAVFRLTFWGFESLMIMVNVLIVLRYPTRIPKLTPFAKGCSLPSGAGEGNDKDPSPAPLGREGLLGEPIPSIGNRLTLQPRVGLTGILLFFILNAYFPLHNNNRLYQTLQPMAIQGNLSIEAERLYLNQNDRNAYYQTLIQKALRQYPQTKLILLPEGVLTKYWPFQTPIPLLAGGIYAVDRHYYNGALLFQKQKPPQYMAKRILVPFGETTPFIPDAWMQAWLKPFGIEYSLGFQTGSWDQSPLTLAGFKIGPLICFEALYPTLTQHYRHEGVQLLVTFSNLGWYHQHPMLEQQFLAINQIRAAETHTPLILVTNTGVSAFIDNRGRILSRASSGSLKLFKFNDDNSL